MSSKINVFRTEDLPSLAGDYLNSENKFEFTDKDIDALKKGEVPEVNFIAMSNTDSGEVAKDIEHILQWAKESGESLPKVDIVGVWKDEEGDVVNFIHFLYRVEGGAKGIAEFIAWFCMDRVDSVESFFSNEKYAKCFNTPCIPFGYWAPVSM